jgi:hypothetical protein
MVAYREQRILLKAYVEYTEAVAVEECQQVSFL